MQIQGILSPPNAAVTAKEVKIDAVVGAAAMARTNAERMQRERKGQLITETRISVSIQRKHHYYLNPQR